MNDPLDPQTSDYQVMAALEASCGALVALESACAHIAAAERQREAAKLSDAKAQTSRAIESARQAISALRVLTHDGEAISPDLGFVLSEDLGSADAVSAPVAYPRRLRTA